MRDFWDSLDNDLIIIHKPSLFSLDFVVIFSNSSVRCMFYQQSTLAVQCDVLFIR